MAKMLTVLPHCVGSKPMNQEEAGFEWFVNLGHPTMHAGAIAITYVGYDRPKTGDGKRMAVKPIYGSRKTEASGKLKMRKHINLSYN